MNEGQLHAMLQQLAQKLGMSEEQLLQSAKNGTLTQQAAQSGNPALQKLLTDPQAARQLLATPQARQLLQMLGIQPPQES